MVGHDQLQADPRGPAESPAAEPDPAREARNMGRPVAAGMAEVEAVVSYSLIRWLAC